jgi:transcriptional regulator with XRE-family HTH domain/tetratricopeptide (TPR) repeat protein
VPNAAHNTLRIEGSSHVRLCANIDSVVLWAWPGHTERIRAVSQSDKVIPNHRLRRERELRNWSQEEVAEQIGTTFVTVSRWERGITVPSRYHRTKLCTLFGKSAEELGLSQYAPHSDPDDGGAAYPHWFLHEPRTQPSMPTVELSNTTLPPIIARGAQTLIGRKELLSQIKGQLLGGLSPVALMGLPGVGKTALAVALINDHEILNRFGDGVLWAGLGPQPNVLGLLGAWGAALGLTPTELSRLSGVEDRARAIRSVMGTRRMLLVIDDAWEAESGLAFKVGGPQCAYLFTTRFPAVALRVAGDAFTVVQELSDTEGVALLEQMAPEVVKSEPNDSRVLVSSVGGLPLALALMGRYLSVQAHSGQPRRVHGALDRLKRTTERLRLAEPTSPGERPPSLRASTYLSLEAVIEVSDQLLSEPARAALRALAIFPAKPNSFAEEAALAVSAASEDTLDALSDAGLLESSGPGRYTLHRTIADYARHRLTDAAPAERLVDHFVPFMEAHARDYPALDLESNNVLAALQVAHERGYHRALVRGVVAVAPYLKARGLYSVAETLLRRAEQCARALGDGGRLARIVMHLGRVAELEGEATRADELYAEGLRIAREIGDREATCAVLSYWGGAMVNYCDYERAERYIREGLTLARELGHQQRISVHLRLLGEIADSRGEYARGEALAQEGLVIAQEIGDWENVSALLQNLGAKAERCGSYDQAERHYADGLDAAHAIDHRQRISALLINRGSLATRRQRYDEATALNQEGLDLARLIGDRHGISSALRNLGVIARCQERHDAAEAFLSESLDVARTIGHPWLVSEALSEWGELLWQQQHVDKASARFQEALAIARKVQVHELVAMALYGLARIAAAHGDRAAGRQQGQESLDAYAAMGHARAREVSQWLATVQ